MRIIGTFNPDLVQESFVFWAVVGNVRDLRRIEDLNEGLVERVSKLPDDLQLVYGWYTTQGNRTRGWMAPLNHSLNELFTLFHNTEGLRRTFETHGDAHARQEGGGALLPPDRLWGIMRDGGNFNLRLRHTRDNVVGSASIRVTSARRHGNRMRFELVVIHRREGRHPYPETYDNAWVLVDSHGRWGKIEAIGSGVGHELVLA